MFVFEVEEAMRFPSTILRRDDGRWCLVHESSELGRVEATGVSRKEVIDKLRGEIRYRLELCPCSGQSYQHIRIEITGN